MNPADFDNNRQPLFMRPGHRAGDLVEASQWRVLREERGLIDLDVHLPDHLLNPFGQLFGGFVGTYVDLVAIYALRTLYTGLPGSNWTSTVNMRIDFLEPVVGPRFRLNGEVIKNGRSTCLTSTRFTDAEGTLLVYALTTLRNHSF